MKNETKTTIQTMSHARGFQISGLSGYTLSIGVGAGHYCENYTLSIGGDESEYKPTATMEVAVMDCETGEFVCLPYDVAGHVPGSNLCCLIEAVESHDWERVCLLCNETGEPDFSKFPNH